MLRRPRTLVMLGLFALMPVTIAIGVVASNRTGGLVGNVLGNGLVLPVVTLILAQALLLPLAVGMAAADALAGEAAAGTLRGLLLAPVSRLRLVGMKAFGVLVVAAARHRRDRGRRRARRDGAGRRHERAHHAVGHDRRGRRRAGPDRARRRLDGGPARGDRRGRARRLGVDGAPAGRARERAGHGDRLRGAERDPGARLAAALPADVRLDVRRGRAARPAAAHGLVESTLRALCYLALGGGLTAYRMLRRDA